MKPSQQTDIVENTTAIQGNYSEEPASDVSQSSQSGWLRATAYLPEFFIMLVTLASIVGATLGLINFAIISYTSTSSPSAEAYSYSADYSSWQSQFALAVLIIALPVFVWLYIRSVNYEKSVPAVTTNKWRRGFLGAFLIYEAVSLIGSLVGMAFILVTKISGLEVSALFFNVQNTQPWGAVVLDGLLAAAVYTYVIWRMSWSYRRTA